MSRMSQRDQTIAAVAGVVVLYAAAVLFWFMAQADAWTKSEKKYRRERDRFRQEERLISEKSKWAAAYDEEREKMPQFSESEKGVDTHWLERMDSLAVEHHVAIMQRDPQQETRKEDVFELPIDVKNWEGSLESLVSFMNALQGAEGAMFDMRSISVKPSSHKGFLKGSFTLSCAYMRGGEGE